MAKRKIIQEDDPTTPENEEVTEEVELTEEEAARLQAEEEAKAKAEAEAADRKANPRNWVGVVGQTGEPSYFKNVSAPICDRTVTVGGLRYEHVSEDADGVWIYRNAGR